MKNLPFCSLIRVLSFRIYYLACFILLNLNASYAQYSASNESFDKEVGRSPEASSIRQYGYVNHNKFNGINSQSYQLHTIDFYGKELPIELHYSFSGLKVSEEASIVGLGWSLQAGGIITRSIRDVDDFRINGNMKYGWIYQRDFEDEVRTDPIGNHFETLGIKGDLLDKSGNNRPDLVPDEFNVDIFGKKLTFILEKIDRIKTDENPSPSIIRGFVLDEFGYKVSYNLNNHSFEIIDDLGYKYLFNTINRSTLEVGCVNTQNDIITSWLIDKIISPAGNEITFEYTDPIEVITYAEYHSTSIEVCTASNPYPGLFLPDFIGTVGSCELTSSHEERYISRINKGNASIKFDYTDRLDLTVNNNNFGKKLDEIEIKFNNKVAKNIIFSSSYFNTQDLTSENKTELLRLKLDSFTKGDKKHSFEYNSPNLLPNKRSLSYDYWGYYNGVETDYLYPPYYGEIDPCRPMSAIGASANRDPYIDRSKGTVRMPDPTFAQIGSLSKVTYPTAGYSTFTYEGNTIRKRYTEWDFWEGKREMNPLIFQNEESNDKTFSFSADQTVTLGEYNYSLNHVKLDFRNPYRGQSFNVCSYVEENDLYTTTLAKLTKTDGTVVKEYTYSDYIFELYELREYQCDYLEGNKHSSVIKFVSGQLETGSYDLYLKADENILVKASISLHSKEDRYRNMQVGGIRLASSTNYLSNGQVELKKEFAYIDDSGFSSGRLFSNLLFTNETEHYSGVIVSIKPIEGIRFHEKGETNLNLFGNSLHNRSRYHVGYKDVIESIVTNGSNKKIFKYEYYFDPLPTGYMSKIAPSNPIYHFGGTLFRQVGSFYNYSYESSTLTNYPNYSTGSLNALIRNGKLKSKTLYEGEEGIQVEKYKYEKLSFDSRAAAYVEVGGIEKNLRGATDLFGFRFFKYEAAKYVLDEIDFEYGKSSKKINKISQFDYNDLGYKVYTSINNPSENLLKEEYIYYPSDYSVLNNLINSNMLAYPVKKQGYKNSILASGQIREYSDEGNIVESHSLNEKVSDVVHDPNSIVPSSFSNDYSISYYSNSSRIKELTKKNGEIVTFLWGYDNEYIVAKLVGLSMEDVENKISFELTQLNSEKNSQQIKDLISQLREDLEDESVLIESYTHIPLIGISSITDFNGKTIEYEYDDFGNLETKLDEDGNILQMYKVNYVNK